MIPRPKRTTGYRKRQAETRDKDSEYMGFIARLPCAVCGSRPVEVAHVGDRGYGVKCSAKETIPLCAEHHRLGNLSAHRIGTQFWPYWKIDRNELIARLQSLWEAIQIAKKEKKGCRQG